MTPRTIGHDIHLCFSEGRSSGSLMVTTSPDGFLQAIAQAWGERIITPSSTAWPPTRVSSPLSRAGRSCTATIKRTKFLKERTRIKCSRRGKSATTLGYHRRNTAQSGIVRTSSGMQDLAMRKLGELRAPPGQEKLLHRLSF